MWPAFPGVSTRATDTSKGDPVMKRATNSRTILASLAFAALAFTAAAAFADEAKVPTTAAEHEARAKQYKDQAAQFKKVAEEHKAMAEAYKKGVAMPEMKGG